MPPRHVIRLGDPTSHGGTVVSAAGHYLMDGVAVARLGDHCTCPVHGHNGCVIVQGDPAWTIEGRPVALEGHLTSCGSALISTFGRLVRDPGFIVADTPSHSLPADSRTPTERGGENPSDANSARHALRFQGRDKATGEPLAHWAYLVVREDGSVTGGTTDAQGYTDAVEADHPEHIAVHFVFRAPNKELQREQLA